jgi:hypothetical protein
MRLRLCKSMRISRDKRFAKEGLHQSIRHAPASELEPRHVATRE